MGHKNKKRKKQEAQPETSLSASQPNKLKQSLRESSCHGLVLRRSVCWHSIPFLLHVHVVVQGYGSGSTPSGIYFLYLFFT